MCGITRFVSGKVSVLRPDGLPGPGHEAALTWLRPHPHGFRAAWERVLGADPAFGCEPGRRR